MKSKQLRYPLLAAGVSLVLLMASVNDEAFAHKEKHTADQLQAFDDVFMEQVKMGDLLFHGDPEAQKKMNVSLSKTGMACAMCHPFTSDTHPHEFPKFQEQMNEIGRTHV